MSFLLWWPLGCSREKTSFKQHQNITLSLSLSSANLVVCLNANVFCGKIQIKASWLFILAGMFLALYIPKSLHASMVCISNIKITLDLLIYTSFVSVTSENKKQQLKNDTKTDVTWNWFERVGINQTNDHNLHQICGESRFWLAWEMQQLRLCGQWSSSRTTVASDTCKCSSVLYITIRTISTVIYM